MLPVYTWYINKKTMHKPVLFNCVLRILVDRMSLEYTGTCIEYTSLGYLTEIVTLTLHLRIILTIREEAKIYIFNKITK